MSVLLCLWRIKVLTFRGLFIFIRSIINEGITLHALLSYSADMFGDDTAFIQQGKKVSYRTIYQRTCNLTANLSESIDLKKGSKVALLSTNSIDFCISLFAISRMGADVFLLNPDISKYQFDTLHLQHQFDFVIYENEKIATTLNHSLRLPFRLINDGTNGLTNLMLHKNEYKQKRKRSGNIVLLTGGTSGKLKSVSRKHSISDFLYPLSALVNELNLHKLNTIYIPVPIFHGFGLSSMIVSILLGTEIHLTHRFHAQTGTQLIHKYRIEAVALVPTMLHRMLNESPTSLASLKRIISGGAPLNPQLITDTNKHLGKVLYNLYGTTEAGFCILATPHDLHSNPQALGRAIEGAKVRVHGTELEVKNRWSIGQKKNNWVKTGDLAFIDDTHLIYLKGRTDHMIVSGGENVYPIELEAVLSLHPLVDEVSVLGIPDPEYGARLKAFVILKHGEKITEQELIVWLKTMVLRHQVPANITFLEDLPLSSIGKIDQVALAKTV